MQAYSNPTRECEATSLPDLEIFQLTATEVAQSSAYEDEQYDFSKRREFRLANISGKVREAMLDAMVEELGIQGGWFWWPCFPGCLPDGDMTGPFDTYAEALADAQDC